jgi:hypothetical protein
MNHKRKLTAAVSALMVGILFSLGTFGFSASAATAKPKAGALCLKSQLGKRSSDLVCSKSGTRFRWFVRQSPSKSPSADAATAATTTGPSTIEVVSLIFGSFPTTNSTGFVVTCSGLASDPTSSTKEVKFGSQSATDQIQFLLQAPSATNPTGSSCLANVSIAGVAPSALQVLVNGRSVAGPAAAATLAVPSFTADGPLVLTIIQSASSVTGPNIATPLAPTVPPSNSAPTATATAPPTTIVGTPSTTTLPGATAAPPASGKPEIQVKLSGTLPSTIQGVDVKVTCTPVPGSTVFQVYSARVTVTGLFIVPATLSQSTSCQVEGLLVGASNTSDLKAQIFVRGQRVAGPTLGASVNSPAFAASEPFRATVEFTFGPVTASTTPPTSTPPSASTTTVPGTISVGTGTNPSNTSTSGLSVAAATGTVPTTDIGYKARLTCTNVVVNGENQPSYSFESNFPPTGGSTLYAVTGQANSQCQVNVSTLSNSVTPAATGAIQIAVNGTSLANGTRNATTPSFSATAPFQVRVTVGY